MNASLESLASHDYDEIPSSVLKEKIIRGYKVLDEEGAIIGYVFSANAIKSHTSWLTVVSLDELASLDTDWLALKNYFRHATRGTAINSLLLHCV